MRSFWRRKRGPYHTGLEGCLEDLFLSKELLGILKLGLADFYMITYIVGKTYSACRLQLGGGFREKARMIIDHQARKKLYKV